MAATAEVNPLKSSRACRSGLYAVVKKSVVALVPASVLKNVSAIPLDESFPITRGISLSKPMLSSIKS